MVQNKTGNVSYKIHKQVEKPEGEWIRVENTHEPLISQETWDLVRKLDEKNVRNRTNNSGTTSLFSGILNCADCRSTMRYYHEGRKHKDGSPSEYKSYACGRYATGGKTVCSAHILNQRMISEIVLLDIRIKAIWAQNDPTGLKEKVRKQKNSANTEQLRTLQATLAATEKRLAELEKLVQSVYEDKVRGTIPETFCVQLMQKYENERVEKLAQKAELSAKIETMQQTEHGTDEWISMIQDYSKLEVLDRPTLLTLIQKIEVGGQKMVNGQDEREIRIYYNFVGFVEL